jgi:hypothetical protein
MGFEFPQQNPSGPPTNPQIPPRPAIPPGKPIRVPSRKRDSADRPKPQEGGNTTIHAKAQLLLSKLNESGSSITDSPTKRRRQAVKIPSALAELVLNQNPVESTQNFETKASKPLKDNHELPVDTSDRQLIEQHEKQGVREKLQHSLGTIAKQVTQTVGPILTQYKEKLAPVSHALQAIPINRQEKIDNKQEKNSYTPQNAATLLTGMACVNTLYDTFYGNEKGFEASAFRTVGRHGVVSTVKDEIKNKYLSLINKKNVDTDLSAMIQNTELTKLDADVQSKLSIHDMIGILKGCIKDAALVPKDSTSKDLLDLLDPNPAKLSQNAQNWVNRLKMPEKTFLQKVCQTMKEINEEVQSREGEHEKMTIEHLGGFLGSLIFDNADALYQDPTTVIQNTELTRVFATYLLNHKELFGPDKISESLNVEQQQPSNKPMPTPNKPSGPIPQPSENVVEQSNMPKMPTRPVPPPPIPQPWVKASFQSTDAGLKNSAGALPANEEKRSATPPPQRPPRSRTPPPLPKGPSQTWQKADIKARPDQSDSESSSTVKPERNLTPPPPLTNAPPPPKRLPTPPSEPNLQREPTPPPREPTPPPREPTPPLRETTPPPKREPPPLPNLPPKLPRRPNKP